MVDLIRKISLPLTLLTAAIPLTANALPIDWNGAFGADYNYMSDYRKVSGDGSTASNAGSQELESLSGSRDTLKYQSILFRLNPTILINDSASIKGEISRGYARTSFMGESDNADKNSSETTGNPLFLGNTAAIGGNELVLSKIYAELYSDTATYQIGRHSFDWALGAMADSGSDVWDRHSFVRDGVTMKMKLGYFHISPFYSVPVANGLTHGSKVTDYGFSLLYDNPERDLIFGMLYSLKKGNSNQQVNLVDDNTANDVTMTETNIRLVDLYLKKTFGNFVFQMEIPWITGEMGTIYNGSATKYDSSSFIFATSYKLNNSFTAKLDAGHVAGDEGKTDKFKGVYLNPNFKIAKILFTYNLANPQDASIYDGNVTNVQYLKLHGDYRYGKWTLSPAMIYAKALETAKSGSTAFNHQKQKQFTAAASQGDSYGTELDFDFSYQWSSEVELGGYFAYLFTGDYWGYTNTASEDSTEDVMALQFRTSINF